MKEQLLPSLWLIGVSIATSLLGQTSIKLGVSRPGAIGLTGLGPVELVLVIARSPLVLGGLLLYAIGALAWIVVLSRLDLNLAYPFLALNFVLVTVVSRVFLSEPVPELRWLGIACICIGIVLVARSATLETS